MIPTVPRSSGSAPFSFQLRGLLKVSARCTRRLDVFPLGILKDIYQSALILVAPVICYWLAQSGFHLTPIFQS